MENFSKKINSASLWLGIRFIVSALFGMITMPLIARVLSVEEYGIYNVLFAIIPWVSLTTGFGLTHVFIRFIPEAMQKQDYGQIKTLVKIGLLLRLILSGLAVMLIALFSSKIGMIFKIPGWERYFLFFSLVIVCTLEVQLLNMVFSGLFLQKHAVIAHIVWAACRIAFIFFAVLMEMTLDGILFAETGSVVIWMGMLLFFYSKNFLRKHKQYSNTGLPLKRFFRYGGFSFLSEIGVSVLDMATDLFVITIFLGPIAAGIYGFCNRIIKVLQRILPHVVLRDIVRPVFFARYSRSHSNEDLSAMFNFLTKLAAFFLVPIAMGVWILGRELIFHIFSQKYLTAYTPLCIIVGFYAANAFVEPIGYVLQAIEKVNIIFYSKVFAIYNLIGDIVVVKTFGIIGVVLVTSSAVLFKNLFCLYYAWKCTRLKIQTRGLFKIFFNSALTGSFLYLLRQHVSSIYSMFIVVSLGLICYLMTSYLIKPFSLKERQFINNCLPLKVFRF